MIEINKICLALMLITSAFCMACGFIVLNNMMATPLEIMTVSLTFYFAGAMYQRFWIYKNKKMMEDKENE